MNNVKGPRVNILNSFASILYSNLIQLNGKLEEMNAKLQLCKYRINCILNFIHCTMSTKFIKN